MHVLGTAGHVDHGKSALVRALTGTDPDRFAEEKLRGMTLDLGFAHLRLADGVEAGIVDVPGHERFLHNMLAGAAGMELLLLVVAANEGPRRQTFEQLAILGYLGVERTIVVLSKSDLLDAAALDGARAEVAEGLRGTIAGGAPIVAVSAVTGDGLDNLRAAIGDALRALPARDPSAPAYLPIDRVFALPGHGTIVTGTLMQGTIAVGDTLRLLPLDREVRARSVQVFGERRDRVLGGTRVAVNLPGVDRAEIARGDVLGAPNLVARTSFAITFEPRPDAVALLRRRTPVRAYVGAAELLGTLVFAALPERAEPLAAQLHLRSATVGLPGAKVVLRRLSPKDLLGGGTIAGPGGEFADGPDDAQTARVRAALAAAGLLGADAPTIGANANVAVDRASELLEQLCGEGRAYRLTRPAGYADADAVGELRARLLDTLERNQTQAPWLMGMTSLGLSRLLAVAEPTLLRVLAVLAEEGHLAHRAGYYATAGFSPALTADQRAFFAHELRADAAQPFVPASLAQIVAGMSAARIPGLSQAFDTLVATGTIVKIGDGVYRSAQIAAARAKLEEAGRGGAPITPATLRDALGTSRKYVVPMLEWFDAVGVTVRDGDARALRERARP
jgi:selenocysteine-specific elongation factor